LSDWSSDVCSSDLIAVAPLQGTRVGPASVVLAVGVDAPVAEVADQQLAAVVPESARRERESPRRVQRPPAADPCDELPAQVELVDVAARRSVVAVDRRRRG